MLATKSNLQLEVDYLGYAQKSQSFGSTVVAGISGSLHRLQTNGNNLPSFALTRRVAYFRLPMNYSDG